MLGRGMNRCLVTFAVCTMALLISGMTVAKAQVGFDRPGGDYQSAPVRNADPATCAARCDRDGRCRAWSFSYPRTAARDAMCWLKNTVTPVKEDSCCVSGIRGAALLEPKTGPTEFSIDRVGGDYRSFDVAADATGEACAKACQADTRCRAFTYVRPGYSGASARCHLKERVTRPRRKPCCISGVVR
ncbi:MAG TPA: PAN domain-containing protein [Pseudorhodoplanes sp.]|nr:PAN domain-containing protein [Pseudorhodoplanes sp.]